MWLKGDINSVISLFLDQDNSSLPWCPAFLIRSCVYNSFPYNIVLRTSAYFCKLTWAVLSLSVKLVIIDLSHKPNKELCSEWYRVSVCCLLPIYISQLSGCYPLKPQKTHNHTANNNEWDDSAQYGDTSAQLICDGWNTTAKDHWKVSNSEAC